MQGSVGAGGVGAGVGGHGLQTRGCGGSSVGAGIGALGAGIGTLGMWMGGAPGVDGLVVTLVNVLVVVLVVMLVVVLVVVLVIVLVVVLVAVFFLLVAIVVFLVAVLVLLGIFRLVVVVVSVPLVLGFLAIVIGFIGATRWFGSLVALGGRSGDGLSRNVIVDWCRLLARGGIGAAKGSITGIRTFGQVPSPTLAFPPFLPFLSSPWPVPCSWPIGRDLLARCCCCHSGHVGCV